MIEILTTVAVHPATWMVLGVLVKALAPAWFPVLGIGKKLVKELTELRERSEKPNWDIKHQAMGLGFSEAFRYLSKKLTK